MLEILIVPGILETQLGTEKAYYSERLDQVVNMSLLVTKQVIIDEAEIEPPLFGPLAPPPIQQCQEEDGCYNADSSDGLLVFDSQDPLPSCTSGPNCQIADETAIKEVTIAGRDYSEFLENQTPKTFTI